MTEFVPTREEVLAIARKNRRVCPMPEQWSKLYDLLPDTRRVGDGWEPALPLILGAWHHTPALMKILRLQEHIDWASAHGALPVVGEYLASLAEDEWLHFGE
jgi:hypothetical protein